MRHALKATLAAALAAVGVAAGTMAATAGNEAPAEQSSGVTGGSITVPEATESAAEEAESAAEETTEDAAEGPDIPITGPDLDRASQAALAYLGEGVVTETEIEDEESYYEIEVTLDDGRQVDVQLDESFNVVGTD